MVIYMTNNKTYTIVGPMPDPVGGISAFLVRLTYWYNDQIERVIDPYPGIKSRYDHLEKISYRRVNGKIWLYLDLFRIPKNASARDIVFNFSTTRALIFLAIAPKRKFDRWHVILHHGELHAPRSQILTYITRFALSRISVIYSLSPKQRGFYQSFNVNPEKLVNTTSYLCPVPTSPDPDAEDLIRNVRNKFNRIFVMSGGPSTIYNYKPAIDLFVKNNSKTDCLHIFLYNNGPILSELLSLNGQYENIYLHYGKSERFFNTFLGGSDVLLRLNTVDSVGFAVRDAISMGVAVIASNVCPRPSGAILYDPCSDDLGQLIYGGLDNAPHNAPPKEHDTFSLYTDTR